MPKKTKKQKLKAKKRRERAYAQARGSVATQSASAPSYTLEKSNQAAKSVKKQTKTSTLIQPTELKAITIDIQKAIILAIIAIGFEIFLYFYL